MECRGQNGDPRWQQQILRDTNEEQGQCSREALLIINTLAPQGTMPVLRSNQSGMPAQLQKIWKLRKKYLPIHLISSTAQKDTYQNNNSSTASQYSNLKYYC